MVTSATLTLTQEQQQVFDTIETTMGNYLIIGKPGVGKSVLINHLTEYGSKSYTLCAPTGLAALNINGKTLHSVFRIPTSQGVIAPDYNNFDLTDVAHAHIQYRVKHLIIDEVSMVRCDQLDYVDRVLSFCKNDTRPFGGVQLIMVGDFFQLPPVTMAIDMKELKALGYRTPFAFSARVFNNNFKVLTLTAVLRQKDPKFLKLLHDARTGSVEPKSLNLLNSQVGQPEDLRIKLCSTNREAENINQKHLKEISSPEFTSIATVYGEWPAHPVEQELKLKIGAQVMVRKNNADRNERGTNNLESKVVNGTLGIVTNFTFEESEGRNYIAAVTIEDDKGETHTIYRKQWERKVKVNEDGEWLEKTVASFEQIPLSLAWAISIHKSQGQSFDKVHIDAKKIFAPGQLYVALSRCRTMEGISLESKLQSRQFFPNMDVVRFVDELEIE